MGKFDFLKGYVFPDPKDRTIWNNKYVFFRVNLNDIQEAEIKLENKRFPGELKAFYEEIGYGFLRCDVNDYINRFMAPNDIINFINGTKEFSNDERRNRYKNPNEFVFYEVSEDSCLTLELFNENTKGECPVYFNGNKIADSIIDFINRMDNEPDYYMSDLL